MQQQALQLEQLKSGQNLLIVLSGSLLLICFTLYTKTRILKDERNKLQYIIQSRDELFAVVSHDLRSAVHLLLINVSKVKTLLSRQLINDAVLATERAELLAGSTQSLLNNLLYWSLGQTGQISFVPENIDLQALINQVCYDYLQMAASRSIDLRYTTGNVMYCSGDVNSVKIILRNLIDNAIKFTPNNGTVSISVGQLDNVCSITVSDTGVGMDQGRIDAILNSGSGRVQQDAFGRRSTGIGFWLVKMMTEKNNGRLSISSEKGKGTVVTITLPRS